MDRLSKLCLLIIFLFSIGQSWAQGKKHIRRIFGEKHELEQLKKEAEIHLGKSSAECKGIYQAVPSNKWICKKMVDYPHKYVCEVDYSCIKHGICMPGDRDVSGCISEDVPENGIKYRTCLSDGSAWGEWGLCRLSHCPIGSIMIEGKCVTQKKIKKEGKKEEKKEEIKKIERNDDRFSWKNVSIAGIVIKNSQGNLFTSDFAWTPMYITRSGFFRFNLGGHLFKQLENGSEEVYNVVDIQFITGRILPYSFFIEVGLGLQWWIGGDDKYFDIVAGTGYRFKNSVKYLDRIFVNFSGVLSVHFTYEIKVGLGFKF